MAKHQHDDNDQGNPRQAKTAKSTSVCAYCNNEFTTRGIPRHHKKGAKIQERDKVAAKKIRSFCIANESVYEAILSFLSNKALTKMQMITGTL
ncbi:hypothetical protein F443_19635 [Phytophthora nicotianae P1569]|uniref:Uncharacterized protein n=1 Tax=Phytophthora nicotianae P1569 TaxID=1317065 RepID=V9E595_PHYNI|nr:hypothetical protein F443_19635 [Phytophthora nicotianae P1569]